MARTVEFLNSAQKEREAINYLAGVLDDNYLLTTAVLIGNHEIDSILICPHAIFCLEFKELRGKVHPYINNKWESNPPNPTLDNPFYQAFKNTQALVGYLKSRNRKIKKLPFIDYLVVLTDEDVELELKDLNRKAREHLTLLKEPAAGTKNVSTVPEAIERLKKRYKQSDVLGKAEQDAIVELLKSPNEEPTPEISENVETTTETKTADGKRDQPQEGTQVKPELPVTIWETSPGPPRRWILRIAGLTTTAIIVFLLVSAISNHLNNQAIQRELLSLGSRIDATATIEELEALKQEVNKKIADETYKNYMDALTQLGKKIEELEGKIKSPPREGAIPPTPSAPGKETSPPIVVQPSIPSDPECTGLEGIQWMKKEIKLWVLYSDKFGVKWKTTKGSSLCVRWDVTVERERELGFRPPPVWKVCWEREYFKDTWCRMPQSPYNLFYLVGLENGIPVGDSPDQARIMAGEGIISKSLIWYYDHATGRWGRQVRDN